jgi:DNA-binding MarR family transcriptional regulator
MRRLEARGHATREPNPEDGRSVLFALTEEGQAEWRRGWPALQRITRFLGEELGDPERVRDSLESVGAAFAQGLAQQTLERDDPKS